MAMLSIRCETCKKMIPTGIDVDYEAFRDLTYTERTIECPNCEIIQVWNLDDVDLSVFPRPRK